MILTCFHKIINIWSNLFFSFPTESLGFRANLFSVQIIFFTIRGPIHLLQYGMCSRQRTRIYIGVNALEVNQVVGGGVAPISSSLAHISLY